MKYKKYKWTKKAIDFMVANKEKYLSNDGWHISKSKKGRISLIIRLGDKKETIIIGNYKDEL